MSLVPVWKHPDHLRLGRVVALIVRDKGRFALALVAQIMDRNAHSIQGLPDPGDAVFEDDRTLLSFPVQGYGH